MNREHAEALKQAKIAGILEGYNIGHGYVTPEGMADAARTLESTIEDIRQGPV